MLYAVITYACNINIQFFGHAQVAGLCCIGAVLADSLVSENIEEERMEEKTMAKADDII